MRRESEKEETHARELEILSSLDFQLLEFSKDSLPIFAIARSNFTILKFSSLRRTNTFTLYSTYNIGL